MSTLKFSKKVRGALEMLLRERGGVCVSCPRCGRLCMVRDHLPPHRYWCMPLRMLEVELDLRDFIDGQILNVLIGNADAHGKNYSLLYQGGQRRLSPLVAARAQDRLRRCCRGLLAETRRVELPV